MKAKEVLKILNVSRLTLHNYVKQGKIKLDNVINSRHYEYNAERRNVAVTMDRLPMFVRV